MTKEMFAELIRTARFDGLLKHDPFKLHEGVTESKIDALWAMYCAGVLRVAGPNKLRV
jgi:hypothetical protein